MKHSESSWGSVAHRNNEQHHHGNSLTHSQNTQLTTLGYDYPNTLQDDNTGLDLQKILSTLLRRKFTIILIALLTFFTIAIKTFMTVPLYTASAKLQIEDDSNKLLDYDVEAKGKSSGKDFYQTQYELLKSRTLAKRTIEELNLYPNRQLSSNTSPISQATQTDEITDEQLSLLEKAKKYTELLFYGKDKAEKKLGQYPVEDQFLSGLSVQPVRNSRLVMVHYTSSDPEQAAKIVNVHTQNYVALNLERRVDSSSYAENFLNEQLIIAKSRLEESEADLIKYTKQQDLVSTGDEGQSLTVRNFDGVYTALSEAQRERITAESNYKKAYSNNQNKLTADLIDSPVVEELKKKRADLQIDYQEKLQMFKPAYPVMVELKNQINLLTDQIEKETKTAKSRLTAKYEVDKEELKAIYLAALAKEESLQQQLEEQKGQLFDTRDKSIRLNTLKREVETNRNLYEGLLQRIKEVGVASSISANNIAIIDPALVPYRQASPNVKQKLSQGVMLGLLLGIAIAFLLEFLDDRIKAASDLENLLGLPMLGLIPTVKEKDPQKLAIITETEAKSSIAEAFRSFRANLLFATKEGIPRVLHITSPRPSEGKSSTVVNLGIAFAQSGKQVLIVDGDLRKPSLHQRLKLDNSKGFTNFLTQQEEAVDVIQTTDIDNLFIIPAGPISPNPAELLSSQRMEDLYQLVPEQYDIIIMDSPPIMGLSDALILANQASATVLLAAHGESRKRLLQDGLQKLQHAQANIIGSVLTKTKARHGYGYSYYYNYNYYDYYSYGSDDNKQLEKS